MRAQVIADVLGTSLVADVHLVTAPSAPRDPLQQQFAIARSAPGLVAHVFGSVVADDASDLLVGVPIDIGRIAVLDDEPPLVDRSRCLRRCSSVSRFPQSGSSVDKRSGIGRVLQDRDRKSTRLNSSHLGSSYA